MSNQAIYSVPVPKPPRGAFNLSHEYKTSAEMGLLIPTLALELMPGSVVNVDVTSHIIMQPLQQRILHNIGVRFDLFFCPYRNLWDNPADADDNFVDFITGGEDGDLTPTFPSWNPATKTVHSLWDLLGHETGVTPTDRLPSALPARAYGWIFNEWYQNAEVDTPITIDLTGGTDTTDYAVQSRRWPHDYYTSALEDQQRGTAGALPVTISGDGGDITLENATDSTERVLQTANNPAAQDRLGLTTQPSATDSARWGDPGLQATSVNIVALRLSVAKQKHLERMNLFGTRWTEFLMGHFGVRISDDAVQRPIHIGSVYTPITISEVIQSSATGLTGGSTALGEVAGHGVNIDANHLGRYRAKEWGILMGIMTIMPEADYQQGIDRMWIKSDRYDFYTPEFAELSDQAIEEVELKASATGAENVTIFGYIGAWDQYRSRPNRVCGYFRRNEAFEHWVLAREFTSRPALNSDFATMKGTYALDPNMKRPFVVADEYSFLCQIGNNIRAILPIPQYARPGGI